MNDYNDHTDLDLCHLIQQNDLGAFEELYNRYWKKLFAAAFDRIRLKEPCEEIIQEIFVSFWEKRQHLHIVTGVGSFLYKAVKYKVIDHYRKKLTQQKHLNAVQTGGSIDNSVEENVFLNDLKGHIEKVVARLPPKCRSVYELSRIEQKSNKEIAILLNISEKTVEGHLTKALHLLRTSLGTYSLIFFFFLK
jgi:RNA polymerase sigma-70 factor (ECF subfamily)